MTAVALQALMSHWRRQPVQLLALLVGLALATGLWSAVQAINAEARASYALAEAQLGQDQGQTLTAPDGSDIALSVYLDLRRAGWQVSPVLEGRARLGQAVVTLVGVDPLSYPVFPAPSETGRAPQMADLMTAPGVLFMRAETAGRITNRTGLAPIILSEQVPPGVVMTDIGTAEALLGRVGSVSRLLVLPDQPTGVPPLRDVAPDLRVTDPDDASETARLTDSFHLNLTAFGLLSFAVGLFIVHGTVGLAFEQRRGMIRTLRALGLPLVRLTGLMVLELIILALIAGSLGLLIGYLVAAALLPDVAATLRGLYGAPVSGGLSVRPVWFLSGLGMALAGALIAGAQALWQLRSMPLLAAPGPQSWAAASRRHLGLMVMAGGGLFGAGVLAVVLIGGLVGGFALLAGVMLGAALVLPAVLNGVLSILARRARGVVSSWVWADTRSQLPGLSLALMALLLALATNIGVGTMVSSFRLTFTGWLDQRLAAELYVTVRDDAQGAEVEAWLARNSDAVLPLRRAEARVLGHETEIYGVVDHHTYSENWPLLSALPDAWSRLARSDAAFVNEQLALRAGITPGDRIPIRPDWTVEVVGIYSDYGNPSAQIIIALPALLDRFAAVPNRQFGIRISPDKAAALTLELRDRFDLPAEAIVDQDAIKAISLAIFEKTFVVTAALNILTLGVAGFAILISLLTLWSMRLPQVAPVWALGFTRTQLARIDLLRSLALAALTALLALPLGLALAWVLLAVINVEAFGWRLPMHLFPRDWISLFGLALLAGGVAAVVPARRLRHVPPSDLLKVFANER